MFNKIQKYIQNMRDHKEYALLTSSDCKDPSPNEGYEHELKVPAQSHHKALLFLLFAISLLGLSSIFILISRASLWARSESTTAVACKEPEIRREWRALTPDEREDFTRAIHTPHLYTLHTWQKALRQHCNFNGTIPYWDWSLDWLDLANSSIWSPTTGFGPNGDISLPVTVGRGHCVTSGPFRNLRPIMYNHTYEQHCLSRGFRDGEMEGRLPSEPFSPESIGGMMRNETYGGFIRRVEFLLHNRMHEAIGGDFLALTAANDPIFFVHHAQIDRLWWKWQQERPSRRLHEYEGKHMYNSTGEASIGDMLVFGGLVEDVPVRTVMDTENGLLCYRYS
ncbi:hypothetical protein BKA64DRAFT_756677 [Cadophora sp. MPI-SDFR-AT-0126]|nr:hypothetical protein BKA64DRAFT_756677 [Leotiomycetes sp. MPI-SDFR-AT-0126]